MPSMLAVVLLPAVFLMAQPRSAPAQPRDDSPAAPIADEAGPVSPPAPLPLDWCLERAAAANPGVASELAAAEAARHRILPAGALEDPRFGYEASNVPIPDLDFDSTPLSGHQLKLAQKLPFPGLLGNRKEAAQAAAEASVARLSDRHVRVAADVERAWSELGFAQRALDITAQNLDLVRQLARIAEAKYRVGTGLQQDVLRAQVELTQLLDERLAREAARARAEASLSALLDLPLTVRLPGTQELREEASIPHLERLLARLEEIHPRLRELASRIEEAERQRRVAELEGYPDFDLGFGYRIRERVEGDLVDGDDFLFAGVTVRLPINRKKWRERVAEQAALVRRSKAGYRAARARLRDATRAAFADLNRADAQVTLLESGLVPQARQSLESNRSGYEVGKVDFLSLVDSQVNLFEAELRLVRAVADRRTAFASLEASVGEKLR
jgi:outer membrane protein TolC